MLGYIHGKSTAQLSEELDVSLSAVKKWIRWYDVDGPGANALFAAVRFFLFPALLRAHRAFFPLRKERATTPFSIGRG